MRLRHVDGTTVHLAYCSNVHQAEDVDGVIGQLATYAEPVRKRLGADRLGIGLWLARPVVTELVEQPGLLARLRAELDSRGLETVTLNAFPYSGFHREVVKRDVYRPDWADEQRLAYTLDCARVLAALLPDDAARGSVSTLPLGWRTFWSPERADLARAALDRLAEGLAAVHARTGRRIRVGFEPEPGCVVQTTAQAVTELSAVDPEWLGICLDTCHLAVQFEDPAAAVARLRAAGLPVVKIQASAAVEAPAPGDPDARRALARLAEPRFLHQTRGRSGGGVAEVDDLPEALDGGLRDDVPWRVHFHAPLNAEPEHPLRTTTPQLRMALAELVGGSASLCDHIEVETYTWSVLPHPTDDLVGGIAAELAWSADTLTGLGLTRESR